MDLFAAALLDHVLRGRLGLKHRSLGSRSKAINIKLKKDKKKGDFGKLTVGAGTNSRYEGNLSFNHFRDVQRISIVGSANNTNKLSYTFNDAGSQGNTTQFSQGGSGSGLSGVGGMNAVAGAGSGGGSGVNTPRSGGINFNDQWGPQIDFRSSYHFSQSNNLLEQISFKKYSFPGDSSSEVNTIGKTRNQNKSHRVNVRWEFAIDSLNSVLYTANLSLQQTDILHTDTSFTLSKAINEYLAVTGKADKMDDRSGINYGGELLFRRKFSSCETATIQHLLIELNFSDGPTPPTQSKIESGASTTFR